MSNAIWGAIACVLTSSAVANAQSDSPARGAPDAEARIAALEARLRALESRAASAPPPASSASPDSGPISNSSQGTSHPGTAANLTLGGYVEAFYQWNFNVPSNGITNYRGFDTRHNAFTISNLVFDASGTLGPVTAHLALQVGSTPDTYYLAEPRLRGAAGAGASTPDAWKFIQQAIVAWQTGLGRGLLLEAGIFLSPVGPEGMAVHDQWNWSRSDLFFGLPFYHSGFRASYPVAPHLTVSLAGYNGWNSVVDNNTEKSLAVALDYVVTDHVTAHLLYFGGVERNPGAPERGVDGYPWRHLIDAYVAWYPRTWLSLMAHGNAGVEPNALGVSWWAAAALYARVQPVEWLYLAARGDVVHEVEPAGASAILFPAAWVGSATATVDVRPRENISIRVEYRHDHADTNLYFRGAVGTDAATLEFVPNARSQDTLTIGTTAWF